MADIENKDVKKPEEKKAEKPAKPKSDKPKLSVRLGTWFRAYKSEFKKISWANKDDVVRNTTLVLATTIVSALFVVLCDNVFYRAISWLGSLISL
jgi:preprotein translocase subunit SecE